MKPIRFLAVGVWNTVFGYAAFLALYRLSTFLNVHYMISLIASHLLSITNAYLSNKRFVFQGGDKISLMEYLRFSSFYGAAFSANLLLLPAMVSLLHVRLILAQGIITIGTIAAGYAWHSRISFNERFSDLLHAR